MQYILDSKIDPKFYQDYESYMLEKCGKDKLPQPPHVTKHGIFHNRRPWEHERVFRYGDFRKSNLVLDTGALHTYFCIYLAQFVKKIYTTDSFHWVERGYLKKEGLYSPRKWMNYVEKKGKGKIVAEEADITNLPYPDNHFEKVLCVSTIEHVEDDIAGIQELARVLKKGGRLLLTTEFNFFVGKPYLSYLRIYNFYTLNQLIKASGLKLAGPILIEKRNLIYLKKNVNVFFCLTK